MIRIFKTFGGYVEIAALEKGCWINVINPSGEELRRISEDFGLPDDSINDILDMDERPRIEFEDDWTLVILRIPIEVKDNGLPFATIPLGIFLPMVLPLPYVYSIMRFYLSGNLRY